MAPKRKPAAPAAPKPRQSKLAKEHNISAQEEREIREVFSLFSEPLDGEPEGVIPTEEVRRAMIALNIPPSSPAQLAEFLSILDPDAEGYASYEPFVAICALQLHARRDDDASKNPTAHERELREAYALFLGAAAAATGEGAQHQQQKITMAHLKRVANVLREDVADDVLRDMILEANGGAGVARGVSCDEFDAVMKRAGVWK